MKKLTVIANILLFSLFAVSALSGNIVYDKNENCIWITGYPEENPAGLDDLINADLQNKWGKISCDKTTDTCTVNCNLWIGDDTSPETYFQLGDEKHLCPVLVMKGNIWLKPPRKSPKRPDGLYSIMNRFSAGVENNKNIKPVIKFDCEKNGQYSIFGGRRGKGKTWAEQVQQRGSMHFFNTTITALKQDRHHRWGGNYQGHTLGWYLSELKMKNTTMSWFIYTPMYGINSGTFNKSKSLENIIPNPAIIIENCKFEHGGETVKGGIQFFKGCSFRDMLCPIAAGGSFAVKAVDCTFEGNSFNWNVASNSSLGIIFINCVMGEQKKPLMLKKNNITPQRAARLKVQISPSVILREPIQIKVVDSNGKPVPDAMINVTSEKNPKQISGGLTITDEKGLTPPLGKDAIIITYKQLTAADNPQKPEIKTFTYKVSVSGSGFKPVDMEINANSAIQKIFTVKVSN